MNPSHSLNIIGLDIGDAKIGVARSSTIAKLPEPLSALKNDDSFISNLQKLIDEFSVGLLVVGIPRNMKGEETKQSVKIREQAQDIKKSLSGIDIVFVDESLSSVRADDFLKNSTKQYDQDSISACYILEEYFTING